MGRILIIEDDEEIMEFVRDEIANHFQDKLEIDTAANGLLGLNMIKQNEYSLVILDFMMPEMDGLQCLINFRQDHPNLPVLFVSGFSGSIHPAISLDPNTLILPKPVEVPTIINAIENFILSDASKKDKIMVVDESRTVLFMMRKILTSMDYEIIECRSPNEALEKTKIHKDISVIITSRLFSTGMNGFDFAKEINSGGENAPVLLMVSDTQNHKSEAAASGMKGWIKKPISVDNLKQVLELVRKSPKKLSA